MVDRREVILLAALECFNAKGIEGTSINDIGKRAGASVGSIYHHYGNKEGIAIALLAEGLRRNTQQLEQRLGKARTARQGIAAVVQSLIDWISSNPDWARYVYTVSSSGLMRAGQGELEPVNAYHAGVIGAFFAPHIKAGAFRALPAECLPSLVLGPVHDYSRRWLNDQVDAPLEEHAKLFIDVAWNTLRKA